MSSFSKVLPLEEARDKINQWKAAGERIVFSNGCFDILHEGHVDYLEKASQKGDRLVIGLNDDDSVKRLKGQDRPINHARSRARLLAALGFVDMVIYFAEDTPKQLIESIIPDVLVKGKDYEISNIVGADIVLENGGRVETVQLTEGLSTTNVIEKIRNLKL